MPLNTMKDRGGLIASSCLGGLERIAPQLRRARHARFVPAGQVQ